MWRNEETWIDWHWLKPQEGVDGLQKQIYRHRADELAVQIEEDTTAASVEDREDEKWVAKYTGIINNIIMTYHTVFSFL